DEPALRAASPRTLRGGRVTIRCSARATERRGQGGQALVEFAIVLPILAVLLGAIYQFAIIFERQIGIQNAIREDARRGAALVTTDANVATNATWAFHELWCTATIDPADPCYGHSHLLADNVQGYSNGSSTLKNV